MLKFMILSLSRFVLTPQMLNVLGLNKLISEEKTWISWEAASNPPPLQNDKYIYLKLEQRKKDY